MGMAAITITMLGHGPVSNGLMQMVPRKLQVRKRGGRKRALGVRAPIALPGGPNEPIQSRLQSTCFGSKGSGVQIPPLRPIVSMG